MSRRTCAATRTVVRKASGNFPQRLRVFRFRSALWASRVLGRLARGCDLVSCEGSCGAFLKPSFVGLSSPSSAPGCDLSAPAVPPSAARGCPCTVRALRALLACSVTSLSPCATRASVRPPEPLPYRTGAICLVGCGHAQGGKSVQAVCGKAGAGVALEVSVLQQFIDQAIAFASPRVHAYAYSRSTNHHVWGWVP